MAKLKFGAWIATYAWSDGGGAADNVRRIHGPSQKCEEHGIDVWVIDHLLSAPGLYGNAWLEPLNVLAYASALTSRVKLATGILVLPVRHPVVLAKEISTLCHLSDNRYVWGVGPGLVRAGIRGHRLSDPGAWAAHRRDHRGRHAPADPPERQLPRPVLPLRRRDHRPRPPRCPRCGSRAARGSRPGEHDVPMIARPWRSGS